MKPHSPKPPPTPEQLKCWRGREYAAWRQREEQKIVGEMTKKMMERTEKDKEREIR